MPFELLRNGIQELALTLSPDVQQALISYVELLIRWNRIANLTAIRDPQQIVIKHLLDSLAVVAYLPNGRIIDVGSGAGLPAIPLALSRADLSVTALDANYKKTRFITQAILELPIKNLVVVEQRVEDYFIPAQFDVIIARAFANLSDFITATAHLLIPGGRWFAMKGNISAAELTNLPGECVIEEIIPLRVPYLDAVRNLVILNKFANAPLF